MLYTRHSPGRGSGRPQCHGTRCRLCKHIVAVRHPSVAGRGERLSQAVDLVTRITIISLKFTDRSILSQFASSTIDAIHRLPASIFSPALATPTPPFVGYSRPSRLFFLSLSLERRQGCTGQPGSLDPARTARWPGLSRRRDGVASPTSAPVSTSDTGERFALR